MEFWRLLEKPLQHKTLMVKLLRNIESGHFAVPKALDVLTRYRTEPVSLSISEPAKDDPVALDSFQGPLARRFTQRQMQLMRAGASKAAAFELAEVEFSEKLQQLRSRQLGAMGSSPLELMQQQEQEQLDAGLEALAQQRLPAPAPRK
ncbi:hypothetical protein TSOC_000295 [Tetrabaena socialis]|uniref:Uncharacterized protein n=1 Tax=Tetrabaena socialis TaxID=47790 RepID=A0A2J8AJN5_9CHLO|nr:hypothetical protein TSOC_000295 [Tetrabaena socialis]|eukprot:PNH12724.1 hypothetical protein TSOC_000295 [Tetrabaena socialis]